METAYLDIFWWQYGCLEHANQMNAHWRSTLFCRSGLRRFYGCFCESKLTSAAVIHEGTSYKLFWAAFKADSICYPNDKLSVVYFFKVFTGHPAVLGISLVRIACPLPLSHHPLFLSTSTSLFFCVHPCPLSVLQLWCWGPPIPYVFTLLSKTFVLVSVPNPVPMSNPLIRAVCSPPPQSSTLTTSGPLPVSGATWCRLVWNERARDRLALPQVPAAPMLQAQAQALKAL